MSVRVIYRGILCGTLLCMGLQASSTIIVGSPPTLGTGSCDPFGCAGLFTLGTYQQVYTSTAFPSPGEITQLIFVDTQVLNTGKHDQGTYTLSLSYTNAAPNGLSTTNPNDNIGGGEQTFFTGTLPNLVPGPGGSRVMIFNGIPFNYNPADGNLLLTITVTGAVDQLPPLYLDEASTTAQTSDAYFPTSGSNGGINEPGLVTEFTEGAPPSVPEPASITLLLGGLGLIVWRLRRAS